MTTEIDVLNLQITDAQGKITALQANMALRVGQYNRQITEWQAAIVTLQNPPIKTPTE